MPPSRVLDMMSAKIRIGQKTSDSTRQIPGTQSLDTRNGNPIPSEADEPLWMKMSTAVRKCLR